MASVTLAGVSKTYPGGVAAVCGLDLVVRDGELLVLVGPSGCGKSTTLRMIAGLETPSAGEITIGDRVVDSLPPRERNVAMVFQNEALYPHLTVRDNMAFALKMRRVGRGEIDGRVAGAAAMLRVDSLLDRMPGELSGGERRRVALGRAIVQQPAVFLFDEPLSNLDAGLRVETRGEIKRLHRELGTTMIYVTHDQEEAMTLGDRVAVVCDGVLRQCDTPHRVYENPADRFVAGFLGTPAMNFIEGQLEVVDAHPWFASGDGRLRLADVRPELLAGESQRKVVAGIRPDCLRLDESPAGGSDDAKGDDAKGDDAKGDGGEGGIAATVQLIEPLGSMMDVTLQTPSRGRLVCRMKAARLQEGEPVIARVSPRDVYLFEPNEPADAQSPISYGRCLPAPVHSQNDAR